MTAERSLISVPDPGAVTATLTGPGSWKLKFRDSLAEMDSRFRGNDVIPARRVTFPLTAIPARHVAFPLTVIPAKAGIHRLIQGILNPET